MIITHLKGGLGNQMFQYACGYALAKEHKSINKLDISYYSSIPSEHTKREFELSQFNISSPIATDIDIKKTRGSENYLSNLGHDLSSKFHSIFTGIYPIKKYLGYKNIYLDGYFQSEKFFKKYREDIFKEFALKKELETEEFKIISKRIIKEKNTISMHIRRGDYVTDSKTAKHHGILDIEYYQKAFKLLNVSKPYIYIFSDDIDWVKKNFTFLPRNTYFTSKHKFTSAQEIVLMSLCKHNIIANSSFSWWGAWLNQNKKKVVIAPEKWTQSLLFINTEITPKDWYRI